MKNPYVKAVLLTFLILCFPVASGVVIAIGSFGVQAALLTQAVAFAIAFLIGLAIAKGRPGGLREAGLKPPVITRPKLYAWFIPVLAVELIPYFFGLLNNLTLGMVLAILPLTLAVGFAEELYFRGLIISFLKEKGPAQVVLVSSVLFGLGHIFNVLSGKSLAQTLLQIMFALLFGAAAALIAVATQSIALTIIWHIIHNFSAMITASNNGPMSVPAVAVQTAILLVYALWLWKTKPGALSEAK